MKGKDARRAFWHGVAFGAGTCLVSLVGAYVVIRPEDVDFALGVFFLLQGVYLMRSGGFERG